MCVSVVYIFFFQAEDGIRDLVRSRGLGDVYKRQGQKAPVYPPRAGLGPDITLSSPWDLALDQTTLYLSLIHI